jgi:hypothetical protein
VVNQGQLCYHTGTFGYVTGDHVHTCLGQGQFEGKTQRSSGQWDLTNRIHYWDGVYVNNTGIKQGYGHSWIEWQGGSYVPRSKPIKKSFPWCIYARKFRNQRHGM